MTNLVQRLRNFAVWNSRQSHYEPVPLCQEAADELDRLYKRLGPQGLEVVMIGDTGHYVNEAVKAEIERLRAAIVAAMQKPA
jgi:multidrug efflux pump subunit AcrB